MLPLNLFLNRHLQVSGLDSLEILYWMLDNWELAIDIEFIILELNKSDCGVLQQIWVRKIYEMIKNIKLSESTCED